MLGDQSKAGLQVSVLVFWSLVIMLSVRRAAVT